jgi:hypothetical protein
MLAKFSSDNSKNARFGKLLLWLVKKVTPTVSVKAHFLLVGLVNSHSTFLKKAIEMELRKKIVKQ